MAAVVREARVQAETFRLFPAETWSESTWQPRIRMSILPSCSHHRIRTVSSTPRRHAESGDFSSNDYLSLSPSPIFRTRTRAFVSLHSPPIILILGGSQPSRLPVYDYDHAALARVHLLGYCSPFQLCFLCQSGLSRMRASVRQCGSARHDILVIAILAAALTHQSSKSVLRTSTIIVVTTITDEVLNIFALAATELKRGRTSKQCVLYHPFPLQHLT